MADYGKYRIALDSDWTLEDLYKFPHTYEQVYFFYDAISRDSDEGIRERITNVFSAFPWHGGYSAVNFYNQLKYSAGRHRRPRIIAINKSSPGVLDLSLIVVTAYYVAKIVKLVASTIDVANTTYHNIYKGMREREPLNIKVERDQLHLEKEHLDFINSGGRQMAKLLGFSSPAQINSITKSPYVTLKILFSVFRRVRTLAEYEKSGKADLTEEPILEPPSVARSRARQPRKVTARKRAS
jgi:hypothetical protein